MRWWCRLQPAPNVNITLISLHPYFTPCDIVSVSPCPGISGAYLSQHVSVQRRTHQPQKGSRVAWISECWMPANWAELLADNLWFHRPTTKATNERLKSFANTFSYFLANISSSTRRLRTPPRPKDLCSKFMPGYKQFSWNMIWSAGLCPSTPCQILIWPQHSS